MFGVSHENFIDSKHISPAIEAKDNYYLDNSTLAGVRPLVVESFLDHAARPLSRPSHLPR
jgi:hypothetical protein